MKSCPPKLFSNGEGLLERLPEEFPRFRDVSTWNGREVQFYKLAQLGLWGIHLALSPKKLWSIDYAHLFTAFADYIVPVGMRVTRIFEYSPTLEKRIMSGDLISADSAEEVEIRAASLFAIARLTEEINQRRPGMIPLLQPQVDYRFWKAYHATHWPHHLTLTRAY